MQSPSSSVMHTVMARPQALTSPVGDRRSTPPGTLAAYDDDYADLTGVSVLVVDDEDDARELFAMVLESCGAKVSIAANAAEAFAVLQRERPQVLVSDIGMPGEDGHSLIRRVRALSAADGGVIPAVAVTAFTGAADRARALAAGFDLHVGKPFEPVALVAVVRRLAH
jgi:CheY-like chemotaxis protein